MKNPVQMTLGVLVALSLGAGAWLLHTRVQVRAAYEARLLKLEQRAGTAELHAVGLEKDNQALRRQLEEKGIQPAVALRPTPRADAQHIEAVRELVQVQSELTAATQALTQARNHIAELESSVERLTTEQKHATDSAAELKDGLEHSRRVVEAMEGELKAKTERLANMDGMLRKSNDELTALRQHSTRASAAATELADLNRRREYTLTGLQRRYREITDQLRALVVRMDSQRGSGNTVVAPDISHIQSAVQSAEEDLRQLSSLNSQAQRATDRIIGTRGR